MSEKIVRISRKTLDNRFPMLFDQPIEIDLVYRESATGWLIKFGMPTTPFIYVCEIQKADLIKQVVEAGDELTSENVEAKFGEFFNKYLRFAIKEEMTTEVTSNDEDTA